MNPSRKLKDLFRANPLWKEIKFDIFDDTILVYIGPCLYKSDVVKSFLQYIKTTKPDTKNLDLLEDRVRDFLVEYKVCGPTTAAKGVTVPGATAFRGYCSVVFVDTQHSKNDRDLVRTITHEMTHAIVKIVTTRGLCKGIACPNEMLAYMAGYVAGHVYDWIAEAVEEQEKEEPSETTPQNKEQQNEQ